MEKLQKRIRSLKNPSVLDFTVNPQWLPAALICASEDAIQAMHTYGMQLLDMLQSCIAGVRFHLSEFALYGAKGFQVLEELLTYSKRKGYYVIVDVPESLSAMAAQQSAQRLLGKDSRICANGLLITCFIGSDAIKPYIPLAKEAGMDLFVTVRTANKSAPEFQDLMTGTRLAHGATADMVARLGQGSVDKSGFAQIGALAAASSAAGLKELRKKYPEMFLLLDGYDYPNANAKNCSLAFNAFGHGAAACGGSSILAAWQEPWAEGLTYLEAAQEAAQRMKKNLTRYTTIL